ncbi:MAG: YbaK/EbsC family protein [Thermodesulfobacteriota bacterium]
MCGRTLPALYKVDVTQLRHLTGKPELHLASEDDLRRLFPRCEPGAMPPFGNLYGLPVWVDEPLSRQREIVFNAGTHTQTVHMAYADFARLVEPRVASFGKPED